MNKSGGLEESGLSGNKKAPSLAPAPAATHNAAGVLSQQWDRLMETHSPQSRMGISQPFCI